MILISDPQKDTSMRFVDIPGLESGNKIQINTRTLPREFLNYILTTLGLMIAKIEVWDIWDRGIPNPIQFRP